MKQIFIMLVVLIYQAANAHLGWCSAPDEGWQAIGVLEGFSATPRKEYFHAYEVLTTYGLPLSLRTESGWGGTFEINAAGGALHVAGDTGAIGSIGPGLIIDKAGKGLALDMGGDINVLSKYKYFGVDLNGNPLFEGHIGLIYRFEFGPGVSYRFQHMSNGGLGLHGDGNTGLDLHMFGVNWNF